MMKLGLYLCAFVTLFWMAGVCLAAEEAWCPDTIKVDQKATPPSPEWSISYSSLPHQLEMVTFFSGPLEDNASLVYDEKSKTTGGWIGTWRFPLDTGSYWIRCSYSGTRVELSRRLPMAVSVCRVTYDDGSRFPSGLPGIAKIECH
ncbi:MAG: STY0301 family protein [Dissulfurispiraceae bacterium]